MSRTFTYAIILIVFFIIMIAIQIDLSKKDNNIKAFMLPLLLFVRSIIIALGVIDIPFNALMFFLRYNIPTLILLFITYYFKKNAKNNNQ